MLTGPKFTFLLDRVENGEVFADVTYKEAAFEGDACALLVRHFGIVSLNQVPDFSILSVTLKQLLTLALHNQNTFVCLHKAKHITT